MEKPNRDELEDQAQAQWQKSAATRTEFAGDFESFRAWYVNAQQGRIKILRGQNSA